MHFELHDPQPAKNYSHDRRKIDRRHAGPGVDLMSTDMLAGIDVFNHDSEYIGDVKDIILDVHSGRVDYAILSFDGLQGLGEKLFAVPWEALLFDSGQKCFLLDVDKEHLRIAPAFDKDDWPDMTNQWWEREIHTYYGTMPQAPRRYT
jgi:sporulation protein YlmC with PRC-barrel domain